MDFVSSDKTLKIGDLVFSTFAKGEFLYKIVDIERRFIDKDLLKYSNYSGGCIGDEYNPLVEIQAVANLSITADVNKKLQKKLKKLDAAWVKRVDKQHLLAHIQKLNNLISNMWP